MEQLSFTSFTVIKNQIYDEIFYLVLTKRSQYLQKSKRSTGKVDYVHCFTGESRDCVYGLLKFEYLTHCN